MYILGLVDIGFRAEGQLAKLETLDIIEKNTRKIIHPPTKIAQAL